MELTLGRNTTVRYDLDGLCVRLRERSVEELQTRLESRCNRGGYSADEDRAFVSHDYAERHGESPCVAFGDTPTEERSMNVLLNCYFVQG
jgi:hypothetical protein